MNEWEVTCRNYKSFLF